MADTAKTAKELSIEQEERIAKLFGGERTPRSGGSNFVSGDALSEDWLVECKTTVKPSLSYSVHKSVLDKADHERKEMHKSYYALAFTLGESREDYFVLDRRTMKAVLDQTAAIKNLIAAIKREISELDDRMSKMTNSIASPSPADIASYQAHKAEKLATIKALEAII